MRAVRKLSTQDTHKLITESFLKYPVHTILRTNYFLTRLEKLGLKTVPIRSIKVVMKTYLKKSRSK